MQITQSQVADLAYHFIEIKDILEKFFDDPENQQAYRKWHREKYGCEPETEVGV